MENEKDKVVSGVEPETTETTKEQTATEEATEQPAEKTSKKKPATKDSVEKNILKKSDAEEFLKDIDALAESEVVKDKWNDSEELSKVIFDQYPDKKEVFITIDAHAYWIEDNAASQNQKYKKFERK